MPEPADEPQFDYHGRCLCHGRLDCPADTVRLAVELRDRADALVTLCSRISGIPFDPEDDDALTLDAWFSEALAALQRTVRHA